MPRWKAESAPEFKQVIPYVILEHEPTGRIYMTTRIGGDERLLGQNSIGLGGHMDRRKVPTSESVLGNHGTLPPFGYGSS